MITAQSFPNLRTRQIDKVVGLANNLRACKVPVRSCDPAQVWESHPVISKYLDLSDREIAAAIDAANA